MSIQPINNPPIEAHTKPVILSKIQWLGRQVSIFGKTLYSQSIKIAHLFYQTIKIHPKKTLAILAGTTTLLICYKGKTLVAFLKSLNKESRRKTLQQTLDTFSKQFSEESKKLKQHFFILEKNIQDISTAQNSINDSITNQQTQIERQHILIQKNLKQLTESKPHENAPPKEKIALLESNVRNLQALGHRITKLITETNNYKTHLSHFSNPFES